MKRVTIKYTRSVPAILGGPKLVTEKKEFFSREEAKDWVARENKKNPRSIITSYVFVE
jgi:hypothetical protein